jgi:hypothetical protein
MIYGYAVGGNSTEISRAYDEVLGKDKTYAHTVCRLLSLPVACHQTYLESTSLIFSCNSFSGSLYPFPNILLPFQHDAITTVRLKVCQFEFQAVGGPKMLSRLAGLKVVIVAAKWRRTPGDAKAVSEITSIVRKGTESQ